MALIIKSNVEKGIPATLYLNKDELVSLIPDGHYFKNPDTWRLVSLMYQSDDRTQNITVPLDASFMVPEGTFLSSQRAQDTFEIRHIIIHDFDGGKHIIIREILTAPELLVDINLGQLLLTENSNFLLTEDGSYFEL